MNEYVNEWMSTGLSIGQLSRNYPHTPKLKDFGQLTAHTKFKFEGTCIQYISKYKMVGVLPIRIV